MSMTGNLLLQSEVLLSHPTTEIYRPPQQVVQLVQDVNPSFSAGSLLHTLHFYIKI